MFEIYILIGVIIILIGVKIYDRKGKSKFNTARYNEDKFE